MICSAPKAFLVKQGIGRQAHHVVPYAEEGHRGPIVPICTLCHPVVTDRQRLHWFFRNVTTKAWKEKDDEGRTDDGAEPTVRAARRRAAQRAWRSSVGSNWNFRAKVRQGRSSVQRERLPLSCSSRASSANRGRNPRTHEDDRPRFGHCADVSRGFAQEHSGIGPEGEARRKLDAELSTS